MKKFLLATAFTFLTVSAHQPIKLSMDWLKLYEPTTDFSNLSEEEAISTLHLTLGLLQAMTSENSNIIKNAKYSCTIFPTEKIKHQEYENTLSALTTIQYDTPKIKALKEEIIKTIKEGLKLIPSKEECKAQRKLLQEQKEALQNTTNNH